jgi:hypothetical protein
VFVDDPQVFQAFLFALVSMMKVLNSVGRVNFGLSYWKTLRERNIESRILLCDT